MARMVYGVNAELEAEADRLIFGSLKGITSFAAKSDILTPKKATIRARREQLVPSGTPDPANRRGVYTRAHNPARPHLNSRDGVVAGRASSSLSAFVAENGAVHRDDR